MHVNMYIHKLKLYISLQSSKLLLHFRNKKLSLRLESNEDDRFANLKAVFVKKVANMKDHDHTWHVDLLTHGNDMI